LLSFFLFYIATAEQGLRFLDHTQFGLIWASDQLVAEAATYIQTKETNIHTFSGTRTHDSSNQAASELHLDRTTSGIGSTDACYIENVSSLVDLREKCICSHVPILHTVI